MKKIIHVLFSALWLLTLEIVISTGASASPADETAASGGTNLPPETLYTIGQLTNLLNAKIDPELFAEQIHEWKITLNVETFERYTQNGIGEADLLRIQDAIAFMRTNNVGSPNAEGTQKIQTPATAAVATSVDTNLDIHAVQIVAMFQTRFPLTNIVEYMSQSGMKLDTVTIHNLDKAGATLDELSNLENIIDAHTAAVAAQMAASNSQTAALKLSGVTNLNLAAITNLSMAATNVPMARTNLPIVAEYAQRMAANVWLMETNGDINEFSEVTNNLEDIAAGLKGYADNLQTNSANTNSNWLVAFSSGAEFLNPYNISVPAGATNGPNGTLQNSGNSTVAYLQFDVLRRWAFAPGSLSISGNPSFNRFPLLYGAPRALVPRIHNLFSKTNKWNETDFNLDSLTPDFQFTLGFLLNNSANLTNNSYSAQTLAGSDIYGSLGAGIPLWRNDWKQDSGFTAQLALWGSIGATTESSFEKVHANEFLGGALDIGLPTDLFGNTNVSTPGLVEAKFGEARLDFPSTTGINNQVNLNGNGEPIFNEQWVPEASANVFIPFGSVLYLNVEANTFFANETPNQWNVKVGATVPWSSVQKMFPFIK